MCILSKMRYEVIEGVEPDPSQIIAPTVTEGIDPEWWNATSFIRAQDLAGYRYPSYRQSAFISSQTYPTFTPRGSQPHDGEGIIVDLPRDQFPAPVHIDMNGNTGAGQHSIRSGSTHQQASTSPASSNQTGTASANALRNVRNYLQNGAFSNRSRQLGARLRTFSSRIPIPATQLSENTVGEADSSSLSLVDSTDIGPLYADYPDEDPAQAREVRWPRFTNFVRRRSSGRRVGDGEEHGSGSTSGSGSGEWSESGSE